MIYYKLVNIDHLEVQISKKKMNENSFGRRNSDQDSTTMTHGSSA
jgi:hypothetical protein